MQRCNKNIIANFFAFEIFFEQLIFIFELVVERVVDVGVGVVQGRNLTLLLRQVMTLNDDDDGVASFDRLFAILNDTID